jgi:hypothetical protein
MLCEKYKPALIEAAITGAELVPAIHAHAAACPSCAAELAQQRSLVAAIDANLHRQMNAPVPAATLHRLGAHLAQQPQPKRTPRFVQVFAGTLATLAVAATILLLLPHKPSKTIDVANRTAPPTPNFVADQSGPDTASPSEAAKIEPMYKPHVRSVARSTEPEVLVPPDERIALEHFVADLHGRGEVALALTKQVPEQREQHVAPVETPDIQITSLTVPAIRESGTRSDN